ncbi:MAG: cell division protein FtsA [Arcobacter sp.]|nr:cell division protein FtsA [Arcobacter sp.]
MDRTILALDIGTTQIVSIVAQNDLNDKINILGIGKTLSAGINKGNIVDIDLASNCIRDAVLLSRSSYDIEIDATYITFSGINTRSTRSKGATNIPNGHITSNDIKLVLSRALYEVQISPDYEAIHVVPIHFTVDDNNPVENPLNMNGSRLEVYANIIMAKKTALTNIRNALKKSNLEDINYVLTSYASAISTLDGDNKKLGSMVVDLGGSTSEFSLFQNKAITFNDTVAIGGEQLTNDISMILKTPLNSADEIKKKYATLIPISENDEHSMQKIKVPLLGNESLSDDISVDYIQKITHARVEELLILIQQKLLNSGLYNSVHTLILTGGVSKIPGIELLAREIYQGIHIQVKNPKNIPNGYVNFNDPSLAAIAGLLMYGLDTDPSFELDSNRNLREKTPRGRVQREDESIVNPRTQETLSSVVSNNNDTSTKQDIKYEETVSPLSKIMKKISEWM